jgi:hypothetical protein
MAVVVVFAAAAAGITAPCDCHAALPCVMVVVVALHVDSFVKKNVSNVFF